MKHVFVRSRVSNLPVANTGIDSCKHLEFWRGGGSNSYPLFSHPLYLSDVKRNYREFTSSKDFLCVSKLVQSSNLLKFSQIEIGEIIHKTLTVYTKTKLKNRQQLVIVRNLEKWSPVHGQVKSVITSNGPWNSKSRFSGKSGLCLHLLVDFSGRRQRSATTTEKVGGTEPPDVRFLQFLIPPTVRLVIYCRGVCLIWDREKFWVSFANVPRHPYCCLHFPCHPLPPSGRTGLPHLSPFKIPWHFHDISLTE